MVALPSFLPVFMLAIERRYRVFLYLVSRRLPFAAAGGWPRSPLSDWLDAGCRPASARRPALPSFTGFRHSSFFVLFGFPLFSGFRQQPVAA